MRNIKINIGAGLISLSLLLSCSQDPFDGLKSHERALEVISIGGDIDQVGPAVFDRTTSKATVQIIMVEGIDLTKVKVGIQTSYKSVISPASGEEVNFAANKNKFTYTVTAESGEKRDWTVELVPFKEIVEGTYTIENLVLYGGVGPEYGGGAVMNLTDKPWVWPATGGPAAELDNTLKFELKGLTEDGKTYGTITNSAGEDGVYADYQFVGDPKADVNHFYRTIPKGVGTWQHDYLNNVINFVFDDGTTYSAKYLDATTIDLGNKLSKTVVNNSFDFTLKGTNDWGKIYSDYDKFVANPHRFWIDVKKKPAE